MTDVEQRSMRRIESATSSLVCSSDAMERVARLARRVAAGSAKVLITGESGVGKDVVARYIHEHSDRAPRAYVAVNCAAFTETLLESELFGHMKGSFTDAHRDSIGKLQLAHEGTVFLDEIGEMSLRMQALLLRFLESGEIQPVGSQSLARHVDVRVITATNRPCATGGRTFGRSWNTSCGASAGGSPSPTRHSIC
jgi:transcriptional regulator with PAS, ATPase and Fis domain